MPKNSDSQIIVVGQHNKVDDVLDQVFTSDWAQIAGKVVVREGVVARRIHEPIFLGAGEHSAQQVARLHQLLNEAIALLGSVQQCPMSTDAPDIVETYKRDLANAETGIKNILADLRCALDVADLVWCTDKVDKPHGLFCYMELDPNIVPGTYLKINPNSSLAKLVPVDSCSDKTEDYRAIVVCPAETKTGMGIVKIISWWKI